MDPIPLTVLVRHQTTSQESDSLLDHIRIDGAHELSSLSSSGDSVLCLCTCFRSVAGVAGWVLLTRPEESLDIGKQVNVIWRGNVLDGVVMGEVAREGDWSKLRIMGDGDFFLWVPVMWKANTFRNWASYSLKRFFGSFEDLPYEEVGDQHTVRGRSGTVRYRAWSILGWICCGMGI